MTIDTETMRESVGGDQMGCATMRERQYRKQPPATANNASQIDGSGTATTKADSPMITVYRVHVAAGAITNGAKLTGISAILEPVNVG